MSDWGKIELSCVSGTFMGETYFASQADPETIKAAQAAATINGVLDEQAYLPILRVNNAFELQVFCEPSPVAICRTLINTGVRLVGALVYYGDDFEFKGNQIPYTHTRGEQSTLAEIAGVALSLQLHGSDDYTHFFFVDRQQMDVAVSYFIQEACGGVTPNDSTMRALMINSAIRHTVKHLVDWSFPFPTDFTAYYALQELHVRNCEKGKAEHAAANKMTKTPSYRRFRLLKESVPVSSRLMDGEVGAEENQVNTPLVVTYVQPKLQTVEDIFADFGI